MRWRRELNFISLRTQMFHCRKFPHHHTMATYCTASIVFPSATLRHRPGGAAFPVSAAPSPALRLPSSSIRFPSALPAGHVLQDAAAAAAVLSGAYALVRAFDALTDRNLIDQNLSRKLVHILSGLLFMILWPIFSTSPQARYFASLAPFLNGLKLVINGLSLATDEGLVKSVTREGNPKELLKGPLYYVSMLIICALVFWRESPVGVISLAMMCGGDGVADIMGRRFGSQKIPFNPQKSWAGSISMFVFGFLISMGMLYYFSSLGYFAVNWIETSQRVALVSLAATAVESVSTTEVIDDNISVPLISMAVAFMCFGPHGH